MTLTAVSRGERNEPDRSAPSQAARLPEADVRLLMGEKRRGAGQGGFLSRMSHNDVLDLQQVEAGVLSFKTQDLLLAAGRRRPRQAVMNLGSNAIKCNAQGVEVRVAATPLPDGGLALTIADTGAGMSPSRCPGFSSPSSVSGGKRPTSKAPDRVSSSRGPSSKPWEVAWIFKAAPGWAPKSAWCCLSARTRRRAPCKYHPGQATKPLTLRWPI